jgi:hypothetical protein
MPVCASHFDTFFSSLDHGLEDDGHAVVECLVTCNGPCFVGEAIKFPNRYVSNEHGGMCGGLTADLLRYISNSKIHRPGTFVTTKLREPGLVGRQY